MFSVFPKKLSEEAKKEIDEPNSKMLTCVNFSTLFLNICVSFQKMKFNFRNGGKRFLRNQI